MSTTNRFNFDQVKINLLKTQRDLPVLLAKQAENYFEKGFQRQSWYGQPWIKPRRMIPGTPEYKYPAFKGLSRRTKNVLLDTGALHRATSNSIRNATWDLIKLVVDLPYAKAHNEGIGDMPKRQFMGQNPYLQGIQTQLINQTIDKIWV